MITFDNDRAVEIFRVLAHSWARKEYPFNGDKFIPPESRYFPRGMELGGVDHARWLFFSAFLNRSGATAIELFRKARDIAEQCPELFNPNKLDDWNDFSLTQLRSAIPFTNQPKYKVRVDWWREIQLSLRESYQSDPRRLMTQVQITGDWKTDRAELISSLTQFRGIGPKIAQLTIGWFQEVEWSGDDIGQWQKIRNVPVIAADIWVMRLMRQWGIVTKWERDVTTHISPLISNFISEICYENEIVHTDLIQAIWHTGSVICGQMRPKREGYRSFCHSVCPAAKICIGLVPSNYVFLGGAERRLASVGYDSLSPHPSTFDDLW